AHTVRTRSTVTPFDPNTRIASLDSTLKVNDPNYPPTSVSYQVPEAAGARLAPLLRLSPATTRKSQAALLGRTFLTFPGADPERQRGKAFEVDANGKPVLVALGEHWTTAPPDSGFGAEILVDSRIREWKPQLVDTSTTPTLSWEYASGTGWWKLDPLHDETLNLKRSGNVRLAMPDDLPPIESAGLT